MPVSAESIARFAAVLADRSRVAVCLALMDGRAWTAAELARHVGIARSTASAHLTALVDVGLLVERRQGRARYLQLAGTDAATVIEQLGAAVGERPRPRSLRTARVDERLAEARTCYDHLAGRWGVALFDALRTGGILTTADDLAVTASGQRWFGEECGAGSLTAAGRRPLVRECLDWTERRSHLGGHLGAVLHRRAIDAGWVVPRATQPRALVVTAAGERFLTDLVGLGT